MGIDFSSAIDNALLRAARAAALRRPAAPAVQFKSGRWSTLPRAVRPPSVSAPKANPAVHAH